MSSALPVAVFNGGNKFAAVSTNLSTSIETSRPDSRAVLTLCFNDIVSKQGDVSIVGYTGRTLLDQKRGKYIEADYISEYHLPCRKGLNSVLPAMYQSSHPLFVQFARSARHQVGQNFICDSVTMC